MSVAALRGWALEQALPLWGEAGFDTREQQFVEQIALDGAPLLDVARRAIVQARQIYVFGLAHEQGWFKGGDRLAEAACRQMIGRYGPDAALGWAFSADRSGRVVDARRDLYTQAFVLLALATMRRLGAGDEPLQLARQTVDFLDRRMSAPAGGYVEVVPAAGERRRQNPHMHLLEAFLAWHALAPEEGFDARALAIVDLLKRRFVFRSGEAVALVEYFDDALTPLGGPDYAFEPGHHLEWVWLLAECRRLTGQDDTELAQALWAAAVKSGFRNDGAIFDEVSISGDLVGPGVRLWPLTEAMKACCSAFGTPPGARPRSADSIAETLLAVFLRPAGPGLWHDHFDAEGRLTRANAPASSLYHLSCALSQFEPPTP